MAKKYFNWKLAFVCVIGLVVLGITAYGLRQWQRSRRAEQGLALGNKAYNEHNWEAAAKHLGRYIAVSKDDVPALLKYADAQLNIRPLRADNVQQTIGAYRTILRIDKGNSEAALKLVEIYIQIGMPGEAELIATRVLESGLILQKDRKMETQTNQSPELRRMLAIALASQRKFKEAAEELRSIIEERPEQISVYEVLGQLIERRPEDFPKTTQFWFDEAVRNNPSATEAYIIRAAYHLRHRDKVKALADLEQAEKRDLSEPIVRLRLAREFINANMLDKAEKHLAAVQTAAPANQALWQSWAQLALKSQSKPKMLKIAQTGLEELSSQPWDFMLTAAELYIRCGELDRAGDCISKLRQKDITLKEVAFLEGLLAEANKQDHKAILWWRRAIQDGDHSQRTHLALAAALARAGDNQSAILQLRTLVAEQPYLFQGHLELAKLLAQNGNWAEAAEQVRLAMQIAPGNLHIALLNIQVRLRLIEANKNDTKEQMWQNIEKQLAKLDNRTEGNLQVKLLQSQLAMQMGQFAKAERILANLKVDEESRIRIAMAQIDLLTTQGTTNEVISRLYALSEQFPQEALLAKYLAALLDKHRSKEDCEKVLKDAIQRVEDTTAKRELSILLTVFYRQWDQNDKAYRLLMELSKELPYDIPVKRQLLKCEQVKLNAKHAQEIVNDIKSIEGENGWQWRCEQANIWLAVKDFKNQYTKIVALLKENLTTNPGDQTSRMLLAATYEKAGELQAAVGTYKEALSNSPDDIQIIVPTIAAMYKVKAYEQADEILNRVARQKMVHPELSKLKLQSHLRHGKLSSAESILEDLMARDPDNHTIPLSLALLKIRQSKYDQARELLDKLKAQEPNSLPVIAALIELNIKQKKNDEAISLCNEMIEQLGNASAHILRGRTYMMLGQNDLAKQDFEHAIDIEPDNIQAWLFKSDFNRLMGQLEEALKDIQKTLVLEPENLHIQKRAIELLLSSDEPDKVHQGLELLDKALASNSQDIELRLYKARSLLAERTAPAIEQAESILQRITEEQPRIINAWALKARIYLKQAQFGKAMDTVLSGLVYSPSDKTLLLLKAQVESDRSPALAIPTLKMVTELYPDDIDIKLSLANTYVAAGRYNEGVTFLKKLLTSCKKSDRRKINIALAVALYKNGNKAEAEREFDLLYQPLPNDPKLFLAEAKLLKDDRQWAELTDKVTGRFQKQPDDATIFIALANELAATEDSEARKVAEEILRMVLKRNPDIVEAINTLAMLLQITGRPAESATLYQQILMLQPDNVVAINNLAWIMCEEDGKYQQALELAQRGLEKAQNYIDLIDTRGVAYYRLGEFNKAVQDLTRCVKLYPTGTPSAIASHFHLGRALAKLGQKDDAVKILKKVLKLNTEHSSLSPADVAETQHLLEELLSGV